MHIKKWKQSYWWQILENTKKENPTKRKRMNGRRAELTWSDETNGHLWWWCCPPMTWWWQQCPVRHSIPASPDWLGRRGPEHPTGGRCDSTSASVWWVDGETRCEADLRMEIVRWHCQQTIRPLHLPAERGHPPTPSWPSSSDHDIVRYCLWHLRQTAAEAAGSHSGPTCTSSDSHSRTCRTNRGSGSWVWECRHPRSCWRRHMWRAYSLPMPTAGTSLAEL